MKSAVVQVLSRLVLGIGAFSGGLGFFPAMADAAPIYVDNGSSATSRTGSWCATTGTYGSTSAYSCGSGLDTYRLVPQVPVSGKYNVYIRYKAGSSRSTKAPFIVKHASGTTKLEFNQTLTGDQWVVR